MALRACLYVCTECCRRIGSCAGGGEDAGAAFARRLASLLGQECGVEVVTVACLAVCKRPCTIALAAPDKWTYLIGDLDADLDCEAIAAGARAFAASAHGIIPWRQRPAAFRKGVIARVPPLGSNGAHAPRAQDDHEGS